MKTYFYKTLSILLITVGYFACNDILIMYDPTPKNNLFWHITVILGFGVFLLGIGLSLLKIDIKYKIIITFVMLGLYWLPIMDSFPRKGLLMLLYSISSHLSLVSIYKK